VPKAKTGRTAPGRHNSHSPDPRCAVALAFEASELRERGERARAQELYRQAARLDPHLAGAWLGLGLEFLEKRDYAEGYRCLLRAVAEADGTLREFPGDRPSHVAQCMANVALFRPAEAARSARSALELAPDAKLHSELLFLMNFLPETTPEDLYAEARRWNSLYTAPLAQPERPHPNVADAGRRLKIGYVSPDLYEHPVLKFLPPVLEFHDPSQFALTLYSVGKKVDARTAELPGLVENFVPCPESGAALEERVRADEIDILVDLAGHTMPLEYLLVFARKPAPIQVSWLGLLSTTGLAAMDYYLGDREMPCPGTEHCFSEALYRLPRATCCYRSAVDVPVAPAPSLERGYITFGSFNHPAKIGRDVVKVWSEVLRNVPRSRILLKYWGMETEVMRDRYQGWFSKEGIARERVQFAAVSQTKEYLETYGQIDIALDPFPYQGGSTTLDTLLMGVPMVAISGRLAVQRGTSSILKSAGLADMVVDSLEQYVKTAISLAGMVAQDPLLRHNVRKAFQSSPLRDEIGFTRDLEAAYRDMWRIWCRKQPVFSAAPAQE
jgi:predicted O-linked N-acetylglucosamine transferase (SPINDLY family)